MKKYTIQAWFTLIELIISITIFSIMMISVMSIFLFSSQMSSRVELNRLLQENIKNVVEDIAENVRKNGIEWVRWFGDPSCSMINSTDTYLSGSTLCTNWKEYVLGTGTGTFLPVSDIATCAWIDSLCRILKKDAGWDFFPLTNSFVNFENISFVITNHYVPKIMINITARPSYNKGISPSVIENNVIHIQTTISERLIETR